MTPAACAAARIAAHFAAGQHHCAVQKSSPRQVLEQHRHPLVEVELVLNTLAKELRVVVSIPTAESTAAALPEDLDELHAHVSFHNVAGQQRTLAKPVHAVTLANFLLLPRKVEHLAALGQEQLACLIAVLDHIPPFGIAVGIAEETVHGLQQGLAGLDALGSQAASQCQPGRVTRVGRISAGGVGRPQKGGRKLSSVKTQPGSVRKT